MCDPHLEAEIRLSRATGVGPVLRRKLIEFFGSAEEVLKAPRQQLIQSQGIGSALASEIVLASSLDVQAEFDLCTENDVSIISERDEIYPRMLHEIYDPPSPIFVKGELSKCDSLAIAIVGTRHASTYGKRMARRLSSSLARAGLTIVSGLARGIDTAAHRGALDANGRTIAVLAGGLLDIYPVENKKLAGEIVRSGALLTEMPMRVAPMKGAFPRRNRLITGLSLGLIVVEASTHSGALVSARHAVDQGREVFAVPGHADGRVSKGCHQLIRDGATLVESADDVLEQLGPLVEPTQKGDGQIVRHPAELRLNDQEQVVLNCIDREATSIDQIVERTQLPTHRVLSTISVLEMRHLVQRPHGNSVIRR